MLDANSKQYWLCMQHFRPYRSLPVQRTRRIPVSAPVWFPGGR
jgi:hypothetical protein